MSTLINSVAPSDVASSKLNKEAIAQQQYQPITNQQANGQSSLDYLYQAISLIETKNNAQNPFFNIPVNNNNHISHNINSHSHQVSQASHKNTTNNNLKPSSHYANKVVARRDGGSLSTPLFLLPCAFAAPYPASCR